MYHANSVIVSHCFFVFNVSKLFDHSQEKIRLQVEDCQQ